MMARLLALLLAVIWPPGAQAQVETLEGHGGPVHDLAVSPGGDRALSASFDNSVGLWSLDSGRVRWLEGHEAAVKAVIFLGGERAASAGDDFAIEVWDLAIGRSEMRLEGHQGQIAALARSPDGRWLASAGWDGVVGLWDLGTGELARWLEGHRGPVNDVAFAADGRLYSASADGTIRVWETGANDQSRVMVRHGFGVTRLLLDPMAGWLAYGAVDGGTRVLSLSDGSEIADLTLDRRPILALAASADGEVMAVGDGEGFVMIVGTDEWQIRRDFRAALKGPIWALAYAGDRLIAGGIDDSAAVWPVGAAEDPVIAADAPSFLRDPETMSNGERQFRRKCSICHTLTGDGDRRAGPTLDGLFGRPAGSVAGYPYSDMMQQSGIVWTAETIDRLFDMGPEHYVPGSKMPMQRITGTDDRRALIEFLRAETSG